MDYKKTYLTLINFILALLLLFCLIVITANLDKKNDKEDFEEKIIKEKPATQEEINYYNNLKSKQNKVVAKEELKKSNISSENTDYNKAMSLLYSQQNIDNYTLTLTKRSGVYNYNGHRETYYGPHAAYDNLCQLDGNGIGRIKRNVNYNVKKHSYYFDDTNGVPTGMFVVASSEYSKQTILNISLGLAVVMDRGCAIGTTDVFVGPKGYQ